MKSMLPLLIVSGVTAVSGQIPVLMLGAMRDAEAAGILTVAKRLADLTTFPSLALNVVLTPALASMWATGDAWGLQRAVTSCARWVTLLSLPPALVLILFGGTLLQLFGQPFVGGWAAMSLLCAGQIVNMSAGSVGLLLLMTGHESKVAFVSVACAALNFALCALLIPLWGMNGAAVGACFSLVAWNLWLAWRVWRLLGIRPTIFARRRSESR
jgi:O-antigen/teichoic acid export membrane protein